MKTLKVMSIIGIVWFVFCLSASVFRICQDELSGAAGWGILGLLYAVPYSIVGLVQAYKISKGNYNIREVAKELMDLNELKEKSILTEEEFNERKTRILSI
jgi:hypothetical protein